MRIDNEEEEEETNNASKTHRTTHVTPTQKASFAFPFSRITRFVPNGRHRKS